MTTTIITKEKRDDHYSSIKLEISVTFPPQYTSEKACCKDLLEYLDAGKLSNDPKYRFTREELIRLIRMGTILHIGHGIHRIPRDNA